VTLFILYPFSVQYVWKLNCWAHILWAFGLALKPGVAPCRVTLPSNRAETSSLPPLHLLIIFHLVTSPFELKLKHWICTTTAGHPPRTAWLPPFTAIKRSSQHWPLAPPLNCVSIFLLSNQSTTPLELHSPPLFPFTDVPRPSSLRTMTLVVMN
jgi:hypothetical protein